MKRFNLAIAIAAMTILLSITALSQGQNPLINTIFKNYTITPAISIQEKDICTTTFYDETIDVYGSCIYYQNYTHCTNSSGSNTGCSLQQNQISYQCKTGTSIITKNSTECRPNNDFVITIDNGVSTLKKQIDYSNWGPCIYSQENIQGNSCAVPICVSLYDGAHQGKFTDCSGGKSCQRFEICDNSIKTFYKNSREGFVEEDPSFYLNKLPITEVGQ